MTRRRAVLRERGEKRRPVPLVPRGQVEDRLLRPSLVSLRRLGRAPNHDGDNDARPQYIKHKGVRIPLAGNPE
jgi:hypothetical protein